MIPIIFDDIFKKVFESEENADITAYLVSLLLKIPYEKVNGNIVFKSTKQDNYRVTDKLAKKDIVFIVNIDEPLKLNLEMNRTFSLSKSIIDRNVYYESNLFGSGLRVENEKKEFQKIVDEVPIKTNIKEKIERIVSDMNFDDELIEKYYDLDEEREKMLRATFEEIYEAKLQKDLQEKLQEESQKIQEKFQEKFKVESKELQKKFQNESKELQKKFQDETKELQKNLQKEKEKTIFTMYKNGLSVDLIAKYTNISIKNINEIIKRNKEDN